MIVMHMYYKGTVIYRDTEGRDEDGSSSPQPRIAHAYVITLNDTDGHVPVQILVCSSPVCSFVRSNNENLKNIPSHNRSLTLP